MADTSTKAEGNPVKTRKPLAPIVPEIIDMASKPKPGPLVADPYLRKPK